MKGIMMRSKMLISLIAMLAAGPALASGWVDEGVRHAAEGPEWKKPTPVASMPAPPREAMPMGVQAYHPPTARDLAGAVASWEGSKEPHSYRVVLDDHPWTSAPRQVVTILHGQPAHPNHPVGLVHDIHDQPHTVSRQMGAHTHGANCGCDTYHAPSHDHYSTVPVSSAQMHTWPTYGPVAVIPVTPSAQVQQGHHNVYAQEMLEIDVDFTHAHETQWYRSSTR